MRKISRMFRKCLTCTLNYINIDRPITPRHKKNIHSDATEN